MQTEEVEAVLVWRTLGSRTRDCCDELNIESELTRGDRNRYYNGPRPILLGSGNRLTLADSQFAIDGNYVGLSSLNRSIAICAKRIFRLFCISLQRLVSVARDTWLRSDFSTAGRPLL